MTMDIYTNEPQNQDLLFMIEALQNQLEAASNKINELSFVVAEQDKEIQDLEWEVISLQDEVKQLEWELEYGDE